MVKTISRGASVVTFDSSVEMIREALKRSGGDQVDYWSRSHFCVAAKRCFCPRSLGIDDAGRYTAVRTL